MSTKAEKVDSVHECLLNLIAEQGVESLSIAELARRAKVSRTWIYLFLGNRRDKLIQEAAVALGRRFAETDREQVIPARREDATSLLLSGNAQLVKDLCRFRWLPDLYFRHVGRDDLLGEVIRQIEAEYTRWLRDVLMSSLGLDGEEAKLRALLIMKMRMVLAQDWIRHGSRKPDHFKTTLDQALRLLLAS